MCIRNSHKKNKRHQNVVITIKLLFHLIKNFLKSSFFKLQECKMDSKSIMQYILNNLLPSKEQNIESMEFCIIKEFKQMDIIPQKYMIQYQINTFILMKVIQNKDKLKNDPQVQYLYFIKNYDQYIEYFYFICISILQIIFIQHKLQPYMSKKINLSIFAEGKQNNQRQNINHYININHSSLPNSPEARSPTKISAWQDSTDSNIIQESSSKTARNLSVRKQSRSPLLSDYEIQHNRYYRIEQRPHMDIKKLKEQLKYLDSLEQNNKELFKKQFPKPVNTYQQTQFRTEIKFNGKSIELQTKKPLKSSVYLLSYLFDQDRSKIYKKSNLDNSMTITRALSKYNKKNKNQFEKDQNRTPISAKSCRNPSKRSRLQIAESFVKVKQFQMPKVQLFRFKQGGRTLQSYLRIK